MGLFDSILVLAILFMVFALGYCKYRKITLIDFFKELKEIFQKNQEEVMDIP